jgi:DNA-binding transcriptional LysR family regulator
MALSDDLLLKRGLRLAHLRLAAALAEAGGVGAAADALGLTQPAASRLAAELEGVLGARLYTRHARGVVLTEVGALFAARAQSALALLRDAGRDVEAALSGGAGSVAIGSVTAPAVELLAPAVSALRLSHPGLRLSVHVDASRALIRDVAAGALDFMIGRLPEDADPAAFEFRPIGPERVRLIARRGHPLSAGAAALADYAACDWVLQPPASPLRRAVEALFRDAGLAPPRSLADTASLVMTVALLARSDAVGAVAEAVARSLTGGPVAPLPGAPELVVPVYGMIRLAGAEPPPPVRTAWDAVARMAGVAGP